MPNYRSGPDDHLFSRGEWFATQELWKRKLVGAIEGMNGDELLNTSSTDLAKYYVSEFKFDVPEIHPEELVVDQKETAIDVSRDPMRWIEDRSRPFFITGTSVDVDLPFSGDKVGFEIQPTTRNFNNPRAVVGDGVLHFSVIGVDLDSGKVKREIDSVISSISTHLGWLGNDARAYNDSLEALALETIERRKEKLLKDKSLVANLGFKMKERPGSATTYAAPKVRRIIRPVTPKPVGSRAPYTPEPTMLDDDYEHILSVLDNMVMVMEQSPGAFRTMDEESLRMHFLVQLNGHYLGDATGETFNYEGKTDILVKVDGRNIFIGECKFWAGEKGYMETIDQVLSYISWRDTKTAIMMFSRNGDFTGVLGKIEEVTGKHPNYKKLIRKRTESSWTYLFGHKDDPNREILVTVQAYTIPDRISPRHGA